MRSVRLVVFSLVPVLVLALLIEGFLWIAGVGDSDPADDPYVGFASSLRLFEPALDERGQAIFQTSERKRRFFNVQTFAAEKPAHARRIFCLGGSTTYGRPHRDPTSFCGWLRAYLIELAPEVEWEVVNAGGISYASYRVAAVERELATYEPDLFIVYTGHNEFLEDRTYGSLRDRPKWLSRIDLLLRRTRSYSSLARLLQPAPETLAAEVSTRLDQSIGPGAYHRDDAWKAAVIRHYRMNLERIVGIASGAGAELLFIAPADNLRSCTPFKSESSEELGEAERMRFADLLEAARDASPLLEKRDLLEQALLLDPRHAHARYQLGQVLDELGERSAAETAMIRARDEDICPLRALSPMLDIVREVALAEDIPLVDFPALIAKAAGPLAPVRGEEWFLDHVHPTIEGHGLIARGILPEIARLGWIDDDFESKATQLENARAHVLASVDDHERGRSMRNLAKVLSWAGKNEDAARAAERALEWLGPDAESLFVLSSQASDLGEHWKAVSLLREAVRLDPKWVKARHNLGVELARSNRDADAVDAYDAVIALDPDHPSVYFNRANALARLGRDEESMADYSTALEMDPDDDDARHNLANLVERGR